MAKDELLELTGAVAEVLPNSTFRVQVDGQTHIVLCYMGGRLKKTRLKLS